jgi:hypothetical protein
MIERLYIWLYGHRTLNLALAIAYTLFILFAHDSFVNLSVMVMNSLSLEVYNTVVASLSFMVVGAIIAIIIAVQTDRLKLTNRNILPLVMAFLLGLIAHFFVFTEMNIEFIHAIEFGLLGVLLYPLVGRFGAVAVLAFPIICVDEWYQYQVLYPDSVEYFDFNDIQLDILGIGLFTSLFLLFGAQRNTSLPGFFSRWEFFALVGLILVTAGLVLTHTIVFYPECIQDKTWLVLNAIEEPYGFWRVHPLIGSTYHVLEPLPGLAVGFSMLFMLQLMDSIRLAK